MSNFPILSVKPLLEDFTEEPEDSTIKSDFEGGYLHTRSRFTRNRKTYGPLSYVNLTDDDKTTLEAYYNDVKCADIFIWTHPRSLIAKNVRFKAPLKFTMSDIPDRWKTVFNLVEV